MSRSVAVALVLALLAAFLAGAWLLGGSRDAPGAKAAPSDQPAATGEPLESVAVAGDEETGARRTVDVDGPGTAAPAPELAARPPDWPGPVVLNGAAVRVDARGVEHAGDDGGFVAHFGRGAVRERREVEVVAGSWSLDLHPGAVLYVSELVLAGVPVTLGKNEHAVPASRFLVLKGAERRGVLLHVLSSADGSELEGVEVRDGPYGFPTDIGHPGAEPEGDAVALDASSPVLIPPREDSWRAASQYLVRAPGHAWGSIAIDHAQSGERTLELQPASALEVELIGSADWLAPEVRLWPPDASRWDAYAYAVREPDAEDRAVFESLSPGTYLVSVERGWADRRVSYGSETVDVAAGERITVPIAITLPEKPTAVRVSGTLTLPLGWEREGLELAFGGAGATEKWMSGDLELPVGRMRRLAGLPESPRASERFAWEVELPTKGSYRLEVSPLLVRRLLEVPEGGLEGVEVVVPLPAEVEVRVVDAGSGEEIPVESLRWSVPFVEGILATPTYTVAADPGSGRVRFRAPAFEIRLAPTEYSLMPVDEDEGYPLVPGENRLDLRVHRQIGVRLTFTDGDATLPWDWSWRVSAHRVDGEARDVARSIGILWFREEGTYELRSQGIPGYRSIDGVPIDVRAGQGMIDVEVPLVRE